MNLHIELPMAIESLLLARAATEGKDVSTFVTDVVTEHLTLPESVKGETSQPAVRSPQGFAERLQVLIDLHPRSGRSVDDNRESIYAGRGE